FALVFLVGVWCHRELAAVIDLRDLDLDLLADSDDVVDVFDALAVIELAQLGDVQQTVLARGQRDERAEAHRLDHRAEVAFADLGQLRVRDRVDRRTSGLGGRSVGGADGTVPSSSMLISAPVSSWIWLIILPLGPMTSPILSTGMFTEMIRGA